MTNPAMSLDPKTTALVLIDLQYGIVAMNVQPQTGEQVVGQAKRLAQAFRAAKAPVVLVSVNTSPDGGDALAPTLDTPPPAAANRPANWATVVAELDQQPTDIMVIKRQWGAFYGTELQLQLQRRGIKTIVLAGLSTNVGVESTARDAYERDAGLQQRQDHREARQDHREGRQDQRRSDFAHADHRQNVANAQQRQAGGGGSRHR